MRRSMTQKFIEVALVGVIVLIAFTPANASERANVVRHTATTTTIVVTTTTVPPLVSAEDMARWSKVNVCEEGGRWDARGSIYSGGLGITNRNWIAFHGTDFASNGALATPEQQVVIAKRIQAYGGIPNYVPDQYGCGYGW